jgi:IclR family transcriptional regulator, KDG regulon repressor
MTLTVDDVGLVSSPDGPALREQDDRSLQSRPGRTQFADDTTAEPVPSAAKALMLLDVFVGAPPSLGVTEIAREAGVSKSTAFRLLGILVDHGFVVRHGSRYGLGDRLFELGSHTAYSRPRSIRDVATPFIADLYATYRSTVHLAVLDGSMVLYLEKLYGAMHLRSSSHVGSKLPATYTGVGKALLAFSEPQVVRSLLSAELPRRTRYSITSPSILLAELEQVRRDGFAVDREESTLGIRCYAAPILVGERLVAAVSICTASSNVRSQRLVSAVMDAAVGISRALPRFMVDLMSPMRVGPELL